MGGIKEETRHSVLAIVFFALGLFFILAAFNYGGLAGRLVFGVLYRGFGIGYGLFPITTVVLGFSFLKSVRPNFLKSRLVGGLIFFFGALGILGTLRSGERLGGLLGHLLALPLLKVFDLPLTLTFLTALVIVSLLIIFDTRFSLDRSFFGWRWGKKEGDSDDQEQEKELITEEVPPVNTEVVKFATPPPSEKKTPERSAEGELAGEFAGLMGKRREFTKDFTPPPISLLENDRGKPAAGDIKANANIIKRTLSNFGVSVEMDEVTIGPSITRYALKPAEGVKLSRIVALQNDLSLALAAHPLRIEAPIPGKSLVGIEVPNSAKAIVGLASVLESKEFADSPLPLLISLGRGISGAAHFANLAKSPHLLIAGATGSGKSVMIHTLITSLLYRNPPEILRFLMIDPKRVELTGYNQIPHLLTPVVTDAKKAIMVLKWAIKEMERRYQIFEKKQVRDIATYHKEFGAKAEEDKIPYIVIIIDELADIMSSFPRELEATIVRLAQMSRAVGIHLVLSTQRPSVEVITGIIKANIPSRIAFQVASQIDSRTILDMAGAEKLLGSGDMLYLGGEMSKPLRIQSAFISDSEVKKVVSFLVKHYEGETGEEIVLASNGGGQEGGTVINLEEQAAEEERDPLYEQALEIIKETGRASTTYLQRKLGVGYARAARLMDALEERGVVGRGAGAKAREIYVSGGGGENETAEPLEPNNENEPAA